MVAKSVGLRSFSCCIDPIYLTKFGKRKRKQLYQTIPACEVRGQIAAQQIGVAACQNQMNALTKQPIDKECPTRYILYFVEKKVRKVTINGVKHLQNVVQIVACGVSQTLVVEIDIGKGDTTFD